MKEPPYKLERPKELDEYILRVVADKTYLIFNRKDNSAYCTRCGKLHNLDDISYLDTGHNKSGWCPACREEAVFKENRYGRKNITEFGRILWTLAEAEATYAQLDEYVIDYRDLVPKVSYWTSAQYRFTKEEQKYFKHLPDGFWSCERWEERQKIRLPSAARTMYSPWSRPKYEKTVMYEETLDIGQDLKYANFDVCYNDNWELDPYTVIGYINNFLKYNAIELLQKSGFERIVQLRSDGWTCKYINWRGKSLRKILKMNNNDIKTLRQVIDEWSAGKLETYLRVKKMYHIEPEHMAVMGSRYSVDENLDAIAHYTDVLVAVDYLRRQFDRHGGNIMTIGDYADYLADCEKLKLDMQDKHTLRPRNFVEAHARTSAMVEDAENQNLRERFQDGMKSVYDRGEFRMGTLMIRPAEDIEELNKESLVLSHCVRSYKERVASGKCAILFVRKVDEVDKPYYTLELNSKGQIVQCRGLRNCGMTDEVKSFVDMWLKEVVQKKQKGAA